MRQMLSSHAIFTDTEVARTIGIEDLARHVAEATHGRLWVTLQ